ncbi:MAG: lectin-like protein [Myxococcales bacterium]|nr:lectin-like protein [Myxococcales bacterium]
MSSMLARSSACLCFASVLFSCDLYDRTLLELDEGLTSGVHGLDGGLEGGKPAGPDRIEPRGGRDAGRGAHAEPRVERDAGGIASPEEPDSEPAGRDDDAGTCATGSGPDGEGAGGCDCDDAQRGGEVSGCGTLRAALRHRYRFEGRGTAVIDSVGGADGLLVGARLSGTDELVLAGGTERQHVVLPAGLLSPLQNASIELWVTWQGGGTRRLLDFGVDGPVPLTGSCDTEGPVLGEDTTWYYVCTNQLTWTAARDACAGHGASLVQIDDASEQEFIVSAAPSRAFPLWIGANDRQREGTWRWVAGGADAGGPVFWQGDERGASEDRMYNSWYRDQPNGDGSNDRDADCGETHRETWADETCSARRGFICEAPAQSGVRYSGLLLRPDSPTGLQVARVHAGETSARVLADEEFPIGTLAHVVVVYDDRGDTLRLYLNGVLVGSETTALPLSNLMEGQNYLGRSHGDGEADPPVILHELRIYDVALGDALIELSQRAGSDPSHLE